MRNIISACLLLLLLFIVVGSAGASSPNQLHDRPGYYTTFQAEKFIIEYNPNSIQNPVPIVDISMGSYDDVERFFGIYAHNNTTLRIAADREEFRKITEVGDAPESYVANNWNEGYRGIVLIQGPSVLPGYRQVLTYQLSRIAERTYMDQIHSAPQWFQDGLASYVASEATDDERHLAASMASSGEWMTTGQMEIAYKNMTIYNTDTTESRDARAQSHVLFDYIGKKYGNRSLVGILMDYTGSGNLDSAFTGRTGMDSETLNQDLREELTGPVATPDVTVNKGFLDGFLKYSTGEPAGGQPIAFRNNGTTLNTTADASGYYNASLNPGDYDVILQGYSILDSVAVTSGKNIRNNFSIVNQPVSDKPHESASGSSIRDLLLPALVVGINIVAAIALITIVRRNWR